LHVAVGDSRKGGRAVRGPDPTAPDVNGARRRYPDWAFWFEEGKWRARRHDESCELEGLSLESLEGKIARVEKGRAGDKPPRGKSR